ncbi:MAG: DUF1573 domain-containing protein [Bacteroidetes bacterium]|nr:DUF1573 domain-containing protein [Bacteroidota bacterium]
MQNIFSYTIYLISLFLFLSCGQKQTTTTDMVNIPASAEEGVNKDKLPAMKFEEEVFDFGTITQGEKVMHDFKFKNEGASDLIISNAYGSCGCTVPEVPKKPVPSGEKNIIRVTFDSDGKTGMVTKEVTILTNCIPNKQVIKIKANIFVPETKNPVKQ